MQRTLREEKGQALALALIALAAGFLLVTPFLNSVSTKLLASRKYRASIVEQYAGDAGIEDAIWRVRFEGVVITPGSTLSYALDEPFNGITASVSVTRVSGGQGGGQGQGGAGGKNYDIVSSAGDTTDEVSVNVLAGDVSIVSWQRN